MIKGISIVSVWVLDQDSAKEFYAGKLGFTVTNDLKLENGMRWPTRWPGARCAGRPGPPVRHAASATGYGGQRRQCT